MTRPEIIVTPGLDGYRLWLDGEVIAEPATFDHAHTAYRAALALAEDAGGLLANTLNQGRA